jgi:hypothetical protein
MRDAEAAEALTFEIEILQHKIEPCIEKELVYNCISW